MNHIIMFTYKVVKHEDGENGVLYGLYETASDEVSDDEQVVVMGQAPVNGVFYESVDELVDHITDLYQYVTAVASGDQPIIDAENVTFVDMEEDCDECEDGCGCEEEGHFHSLPEWEEAQPKKWCCGGGCGCNH